MAVERKARVGQSIYFERLPHHINRPNSSSVAVYLFDEPRSATTKRTFHRYVHIIKHIHDYIR